MAMRTSSGFNPGRSGRRATSGGRKSRTFSSFLARFAAVVIAGSAILWLVDRPVAAERLGGEYGAERVLVGAG